MNPFKSKLDEIEAELKKAPWGLMQLLKAEKKGILKIAEESVNHNCNCTICVWLKECLDANVPQKQKVF